jgi:SprT protein
MSLEVLSILLQNKVDSCLAQASQVYNCHFLYDKIRIDIRGKAAGQIQIRRAYSHKQLPVLRFNPLLLLKYQEEFIDEVVPHECAHLVVYKLHSPYRNNKRIRPHGPEWQSIMVNLYGREPKVTHQFIFEHESQKKRFDYQCGCSMKIHQLSVIRHNKIVRAKANYLCKGCNKPLTFIMEDR